MPSAAHSSPIVEVLSPPQLVISTRQEFKDAVRKRITAGEDVIVDLSCTTYLDSSGCGTLVTLSKFARECGRRLVVCGANADLAILIELTKLDMVITIAADREAAHVLLGG